ncbi:MAG: lipid-A-disaccharide synthase, partial [Rhodocyclaceae bacterium]|nr:lipid-A-disaccharide synthase [Rhodocyclaceae bacterium]
MPTRIAMVAGEASGDLLAAHLIAALREQVPDAEFAGVGGPKMQARGFDAWWPSEKLAVRGYAEVLRHYREISGIRRRLLDRLVQWRPNVFIGVDAPDFNLWLEYRLKRSAIPAIHYVSPSVWAWRSGRVPRIARSVTGLLALFPFEPEIYRSHDVPVTYVGHPLADVIPEEVDHRGARERLGLPGEATVFALLPGSRQSELRYMADLFVDTAATLAQRFPRPVFLVPLVSRETRLQFEEAMWRNGAQELPFKLLFGHAQDALAAADAALIASGTATLEAALMKAPMVITYRMSPWSWTLMRRMRLQPWVGLPNILAGRFVVPEF